MATLTGRDALEYADANGLTLSTADRDDVPVEEAKGLVEEENLFLEVDDADLMRLTDSENFRIFHKAYTGNSDLYEGGPWFYEPRDWDGSRVYSSGYASLDDALAAAASEDQDSQTSF